MEWNHYTRLISGSAASTTLAGSAVIFTAGVSLIGVAIGSAGIHNARKKRKIIEQHLARYREKPTTRMQDVMGSAAFNGAVGITTLGLGTLGAEKVLELGIEHGVFGGAAETGVKVATGVVVNGVNVAADDRYHKSKKKKAEKRISVAVKEKHVHDRKPRAGKRTKSRKNSRGGSLQESTIETISIS